MHVVTHGAIDTTEPLRHYTGGFVEWKTAIHGLSMEQCRACRDLIGRPMTGAAHAARIQPACIDVHEGHATMSTDVSRMSLIPINNAHCITDTREPIEHQPTSFIFELCRLNQEKKEDTKARCFGAGGKTMTSRVWIVAAADLPNMASNKRS